MQKGQRLINKEVDKRVVIYPNKTIKRIDDGVNGLMVFGENNDYPQLMEKIINGSVTAKTSANIYSKFLAGDGFEEESINKIVIGSDQRGKKITVQSLLRQVAISISRNNGSYIHCNYNRDLKIVSTHLKPFKYCRFASSDDEGYSAKILVYDNWEKDKTKKYRKNLIKSFNVYNSDPVAIMSQIVKVKDKEGKDIENYKGQIYFLFTDNEYFYPLSNYDEVYLDCDTEAQLALYRNRQNRNGFFKKTIIRVQPAKTEKEGDEFAEKIRNTLGPDGDGLLIIEDEPDEDGNFTENKGFAVEQLDSDIEDDLFKEWPKELANNIRKSAKGIPAVLIDYEDSKLGSTSGESIIQATNYYNAITKDDRTEIEETFEEIFKRFDNKVLSDNKNWKIKPLTLIPEKVETEIETTKIEKDGITDINTTE